jgi:biotin carboxyl carrier protein
LEYSLDDVLDEALTVREQYSSAVINTALGLKDRPTPLPAVPTMAEEVTPALTKAPSKDVAVETDEKGMMTAPATTVHIEQSQPVVSVTDADTTKDAAPPPTAEETSGSSDMLTLLMGMILSSVLGLVYFVLIGLPLKIGQTVVIVTAVYAIVNMVYLYLAEDYNNWLIRESGGTITLQDLAYFSNNNIRHGIM